MILMIIQLENILMILALAFVSTADVPLAFTKLDENVPDDSEGIMEYFKLNYVSGRRAQGIYILRPKIYIF